MQRKNQVKPKISSMEIGDTIAFPIERTTYVRVIASELSLTLGRKYRTTTSREEAAVFVTREN